MYHAHYGNFRAGGLVGRLPRSSCGHSIKNLDAIDNLLSIAIADESEAINVYTHLSSTIQSAGCEAVDLVEHIKSQEAQHMNLLKQLRSKLNKKVG